MTTCSRCRATVLAHARFCSECGTWVVHPVVDDPYARASGVPAPPPIEMPPLPTPASVPMSMPAAPPPSQVAVVGASQFPPRADPSQFPQRAGPSQFPPLVEQAPIVHSHVTRSDPMHATFTQPTPPARPSGPPPAVDPQSPTLPRPATGLHGGSTQWRTLESGAPQTRPEQVQIGERSLGRPKTLVDEGPAHEPSRSLGRTPRPLGAFLVSYQYEPLGTFWPLGIGTNLIGRAGAGRPDVDVGIADTTVSSEQAFVDIEPKPSQFMIAVTLEDRGSTNGTQVNGRPIAPGTRVPLGHGDKVRFGSFETILVLVPYPAGS